MITLIITNHWINKLRSSPVKYIERMLVITILYYMHMTTKINTIPVIKLSHPQLEDNQDHPHCHRYRLSVGLYCGSNCPVVLMILRCSCIPGACMFPSSLCMCLQCSRHCFCSVPVILVYVFAVFMSSWCMCLPCSRVPGVCTQWVPVFT